MTKFSNHVFVINQIESERRTQDIQWGGPVHDDEHVSADWIGFIDRQLQLVDPNDPRERLIKIAALAIAGIESIDRRQLKGNEK